jgi:hypothetical protein
MDPDKVVLTDLHTQFEYIKMANEIDNCESLVQLRTIAKCYAKLNLATKETIQNISKL